MPLPDTRLISRHWSPDGTLLLCVLEDGECIFYSCEGALLQSQRETGGVQASAWADSGPVALVYSTSLQLWALQDGPRLARTHNITIPASTLTLSYWQPTFCPDGSCIACLAEAGDSSMDEALVMALISAGDLALLGMHELPLPLEASLEFEAVQADWCAWSIDGTRLGVLYSGETEPGVVHLLTVGSA